MSARLSEDPHLWATTLFDELADLEFTGSYPTLTRQIRTRGPRPVCADCARVGDRAAAVIEHPPGDEIQWDWGDLPDAPAHWGWGPTAPLLVEVLAHSGRWRGLLLESQTQPHLIDGIDRICRELGGTARSGFFSPSPRWSWQAGWGSSHRRAAHCACRSCMPASRFIGSAKAGDRQTPAWGDG